VVVAVLSVFYYESLQSISLEHGLTEILSENGYAILGVLSFAAMAMILGRTAVKKD